MKRRRGDPPAASRIGARPTSPDARPTRLVAAGAHSTGFVDYDDLGRPRWSWTSELDPAFDRAEAGDVLKALDTEALRLADEPDPAHVRRRDKGYNPYDTARTGACDRLRFRRR